MSVPSAARMAVMASDTGSLTPSLRTNVQSRVSVSRVRVPYPSTRLDRDVPLGCARRELRRVVEELGMVAADDVAGGVAEHALGAAVEDGDQPVGVRADDRVLRRRVQHGRERVARGHGSGLAGTQRLLRLTALADVAGGGLQLDDSAVLVEHGAAARLHPDPVTVLVQEAPLTARRPLVVHGLQVADDVLAVVGVDDVDGRPADQLVRLVAQEDPARGRHVGANAARIDARDEVTGVLGQQPEAPLRLGQRGDHLPLLGDVDERRDDARDDIAFAQRARVDRDPAQLAVVHGHAVELLDDVASGRQSHARGGFVVRERRAVGVHRGAGIDGLAADQLGPWAAQDALCSGVEVDDRAARIAYDDALVHPVDDLS